MGLGTGYAGSAQRQFHCSVKQSTPDVETPSLKPLWRELSRVVQHNLQTVLGYDLLAGQRVLREQVARLMLDSGSVVTADDIIITSGCHNSMSLALMAVCKPGDIVAVESPVITVQCRCCAVWA